MRNRLVPGLAGLVILLVVILYFTFSTFIPNNIATVLTQQISQDITVQDITPALSRAMLKYWLVFSGVLLVFAAAVYAMVRASLLKPLAGVEKVLEEIEKGNMIKKLPENLGGIIGKTSRSVNRILTNTKMIMGDVLTSAEKIKVYARELLSNAEETNRSAEEIATTISEIAQGIEQGSAAATRTRDYTVEMVENTENITQFANKTREETLKMQETIAGSISRLENLVERIRENSQTNSQLAQEVSVLENHASQISSIIMEVTSISEQTNLLALNAAIEAARAGEQGRGFAVVAEEVRKLAEQSAASANRIHDLVNSIINQINLVAKSMETQAARAREDARLADSSREEFTRINQATLSAVKSVEEILKLVENQASTAKEIQSFMEEIVASAQQSSAGTQETAAAAQQQSAAMEQVFQSIKNLNDLAEEMDRAFDEYRKGLVLNKSQESKIERARSAMSKMLESTAFKRDDLHSIKQLLISNVSDHTGLEFLAYLNNQGNLKVSSHNVNVTNVSHRTFFIEAVQGNTYQSDPYISSATQDFCITISMPVRDSNHNIKGVLVGDINLR